ncbi:DUF4160 domain-containing protein [Salmonirosea aquatica]|uniref:DUF4160 domain-containing protein n=1 Tax=Salmonirosea aquatica TaxID=2654236 RepID=A0A7C9BH18_9BACT|nr:DUF4160 domain-containing protein [Cytophagaceae bacterium SJW1-29]
MPTILIKDGYRFFFYSNDHLPEHIHVEKGDKTAKFILEPILPIKSSRFNSKELRTIRTIIERNSELFKTKWNEHFDNK